MVNILDHNFLHMAYLRDLYRLIGPYIVSLMMFAFMLQILT